MYRLNLHGMMRPKMSPLLLSACFRKERLITSNVKLAKVVQTGWPDQHAEIDSDLHAFWIHRWNLSIVDGIIMNGTRIVIPKSLQNEYFRCLHTGHFGISKCSTKVKSTVYWPGIDKDITNLIGCCDTCRQIQHTPPTFNKHSVEA